MENALPVIEIARGCTPANEPMDAAAAQHLAGILRALAEPTRLRLLSLVAATPTGKECICNLTAPTGLSQPTVSHHMKVLVDAGLLQREQRGKWAYYRLVPAAFDDLTGLLSAIAAPVAP